jgi:MarR family transcriptional regulator for hemolysin
MRKLDLENSVGTAIFLASKSLERAAEYRIKNELGLTSSQWKVILALNFFDGISQKELAGKIYIDGSTLVPVIDKMEEGGLVERKPDPNDRRNNMMFLTKKSESVVDSIINILFQLRKEFYKGIAQKEQEKVRTILRKIIDNADTTLNKK